MRGAKGGVPHEGEGSAVAAADASTAEDLRWGFRIRFFLVGGGWIFGGRGLAFWGLEFGVWGLGIGVWCLGFEFWVWGLGFGVWGLLLSVEC